MNAIQHFYLGATATTGLTALVAGPACAQGAVAIDDNDIGGVVTGASGPEAGVW